MWVADDDPIIAEHLEREPMIHYFYMLNKKMVDAIETKRRNMKHSGRTGNDRTFTGRK